MPDSTQLLRIQYVADTQALTQSKTAAEQAQRATDALRDSAKKAGAEGAAGQRQFQGAIGFVRAELEKQKALIELTSRSDVKLLNERITKYKQLKTEVENFDKSLQNTNKTAKENTKSWGEWYNAIKLVLAAAVVRQVVSTALEMAKLAGQTEGVERAFRRAFPEAENILFNLRRATRGTVDDFQLMQRTLQATNLGVSVNKLSVLFEFAAARAQQTGESVDYLVDSIVRGIGRKSILILDNLGLSATRLKEQFNGASLASRSVGEVTEGVAAIAQQELEKMGGYAETAATKVDKLTASWQELKKEVATIATQDGGVIDFMQGYVDSAEALAEAQRRGISVADLYRERLAKHNAQFRFNLIDQDLLTGSTEENTKAIQEQIEMLTKSIGAFARNRDEYNKEIKEITEQGRQNQLGAANESELQNINEDLQERLGLLQRLRDAGQKEASEDQELLKLLQDRLEAMKKSTKQTAELLGLIQAKEEEIKDVSEAIKAAKSIGEISQLNNELSKLNGELADLKAFGTTKQFLEVNGRIKLVPVVDPKGFEDKLKQQPIFREGVTIPVGMSFTSGTRTSAEARGSGNVKSFWDAIEDQIDNAPANIPAINLPVTITPMTEMERIGQEFSDQWQNILGQGLSDTGNFLSAVVQAEADSYDARLNELKNFYDEQLTLAGNNENQKDRIRLKAQKEELKLRREAFEADKRAKKSQAAINGAVGITNAFATLPYPAAIVASALILASTAAQIAAIEKEKPRFKTGKVNISGPGTTTSDSIDAKISRGESVINASSTARSMKLLEGINSGRIDDRILSRLHGAQRGVRVVGMSDKRIVDAINRQKYPDYERIGSDLYEVKRMDDGFSKRVRRKVLSR